MRRKLVLFMATAAALTLTAPAHASGTVEVFATGANNGSVGFTTAIHANTQLTDPNTHTITHYCNFAINGSGNTVTLTLYGEATSGAHLVAVSTGIYCDIRDQNNAVVFSTAAALPGVFAATAGTSGLIHNTGNYTVCSRGSGQWNDTHLFATPLRCQQPNLPPLPPLQSTIGDLPPILKT